MRDQVFNPDVDVSREILTSIDAFTTSILASGDMELVLPIIVRLVVVVEWTHEYLL